MSDGYYFLNQAVVAFAANPVAKVTSIADSPSYRFGAQVGTTSLKTITDVIKPTPSRASMTPTTPRSPRSRPSRSTASSWTCRPRSTWPRRSSTRGTVVGQFKVPDGSNAEHFSVVLAKGSPVTTCVNAAIKAMTDDGSLAAITKEWLSDKAAAPVFTP